ncbi:hypothetical protein [Burkholderia glumae]|uniref:hypothetical protein n=1 Tax=Burkholderia glumae TaxID=337 RepID=UPI001F395725|nr:hypothetical protein [Burkholderia glumae]
MVDDERVAGWPALGATPDLRTAIGAALARRGAGPTSRSTSACSTRCCPTPSQQRAGRARLGARAAPAGPWWTSWSGVVAHGRSLGLEQDEHETCPEFKLRAERRGRWPMA